MSSENTNIIELPDMCSDKHSLPLGRLLVRRILGLSLFLCGITLLYEQEAVRECEAWIAKSIVNVGSFVFAPAVAKGSTVYLHMGPTAVQGFTITPECTSAFLIAPLLLIAGVMLTTLARASMLRLICAVLAAAALLFIVNQTRVLMIAEFVRRWGVNDGYPLSHRVLGSVLVIAAVVVAYALLFIISCRHRRQPIDIEA
ncbi:hypothetical protein [Streptomyces sp. NPDC057686]|uniref:hypothetical protein n=1 Tax=Streptomyces sp. NPDC057686 TaxID=3346212 RepID=UPI0036BCE895